MGDFFHGWRRKTGCVLLVLALAFYTMWMRSLVLIDVLLLCGQHTRFVLASLDSRLSLSRIYPVDEVALSINWGTFDYEGSFGFRWDEDGIRSSYDPYEGSRAAWRWDFLGFQVGAFDSDILTTRTELCMIPYWAIVGFLSLLSTWLIIWKRPKGNAPNRMR